MLITGEHSVLGDTVYLYDEFNRAVGSDHKEGGVLRSVRYTLDAAGRQLAVTESAPDLSRTVSYTYDPLGNKLTETTPEGTVTNYAYTPQGQVASISGGVYRQEYGYDAEELSFVWQPETAGLDVPLSMKHDGAAYYYVTDGNKNVTALYDATGAEAANYVYGPFGQTLAANGRGGESPAAVD